MVFTNKIKHDTGDDVGLPVGGSSSSHHLFWRLLLWCHPFGCQQSQYGFVSTLVDAVLLFVFPAIGLEFAGTSLDVTTPALISSVAIFAKGSSSVVSSIAAGTVDTEVTSVGVRCFSSEIWIGLSGFIRSPSAAVWNGSDTKQCRRKYNNCVACVNLIWWSRL